MTHFVTLSKDGLNLRQPVPTQVGGRSALCEVEGCDEAPVAFSRDGLAEEYGATYGPRCEAHHRHAVEHARLRQNARAFLDMSASADPRDPKHGPACARDGCGDGQMLHHLQSGSCMVNRADGTPCGCGGFVSAGAGVPTTHGSLIGQLRDHADNITSGRVIGLTGASVETVARLMNRAAVALTALPGQFAAPAPEAPQAHDDGYESLREVLRRAVEQAARGKGRERHAAAGEPFVEQQIVKLCVWSGSPGFAIGQACKKALESQRLPVDAAVAELLGAINYLAAAVIVRESAP